MPRWTTSLPIAVAALVSAPSDAAQPVTLTAADGVRLFGTFDSPADPKAIVLLFHQAGSSSAEYATIAPRLNRLGYATLAIDQRSGGGLFGRNRTVDSLGRSTGYLEALPDLRAALAFARGKKLPVALWGSSYSSSLALLLAAEEPGAVTAVLSFSPGEYLGTRDRVRTAAARVSAPTLIAAAPTDEAAEARKIFAAVPGRDKRLLVPAHAVHGSSMLIPSRNPKGHEDAWRAVEAFLAAHLG